MRTSPNTMFPCTPTCTTLRSSSSTNRTTPSTDSASRDWAKSASSASPRRSPTRSITQPASACATCPSRSISYSDRRGRLQVTKPTAIPTRDRRMHMPDQAMTLRQQVKIERRTPEYWRATLDNPPLNIMGPKMIAELADLMDQIEADEQLKV